MLGIILCICLMVVIWTDVHLSSVEIVRKHFSSKEGTCIVVSQDQS